MAVAIGAVSAMSSCPTRSGPVSPAPSAPWAGARDAGSADASGQLILDAGVDAGSTIYDSKSIPPDWKVTNGECWRELAPLNQARDQAVAVRLDDGRILVAGGMTNQYSTNSAELYLPDENVWTLATPMNVPRRGASATKLQDGRVLVTGGANEDGGLWDPYPPTIARSESEVFDPDSGSWVEVAPMLSARWLHRTLLLNDGRVLAVGGSGAIAAELYDPTTDSWEPVPFNADGGAPRFVALLKEDDDHVFVVARSATYEIDVNSKTWRYVTSRDGAWEEGNPSFAIADGRMFVFGGIENERAEVYDPSKQTWDPTDYSYLEPRTDPAIINVDQNRVLVVGGIASGPWANWVIASGEIFDARNNAFIQAGRMAHPRSEASMLVVNGSPVIIGGGNNDEGFTNSVEVFDPTCAELDAGSP